MSGTGAAMVAIRDAAPVDAVAACHVLRESISRLCVADHRNDPAILNAWLANKTPDIVAAWARQPGNSLLLAVEGDAILGVGSVTDAGEITLNYVAPGARFRGVSRACSARSKPERWSAATAAARSQAPRRRIASISRPVMLTTECRQANSARTPAVRIVASR
ncbi:hypothetical protein V1286_003356 [Bradyrhizobium algeriense]|uniref:GNAT family N-acetyltransferase n=1 Tax=Bradyrhizobium algeriense TaxID=634784 RepID=A0ABU8BBB1_9BRAD